MYINFLILITDFWISSFLLNGFKLVKILFYLNDFIIIDIFFFNLKNFIYLFYGFLMFSIRNK